MKARAGRETLLLRLERCLSTAGLDARVFFLLCFSPKRKNDKRPNAVIKTLSACFGIKTVFGESKAEGQGEAGEKPALW